MDMAQFQFCGKASTDDRQCRRSKLNPSVASGNVCVRAEGGGGGSLVRKSPACLLLILKLQQEIQWHAE